MLTPSRSMWWKSLIVVLAISDSGRGNGAARFQGRIEVRVTSQRSGDPARVATETIYASELGVRSETRAGSRSHAVVILASDPEIAYRLDEAHKSYRAKKIAAAPNVPEQFQSKRLGRAKIGKYDCEHVLLTGSRGSVVEEWITSDIKGLKDWRPLIHRSRTAADGSRDAPKRGELLGTPVKVVVRGTNGVVVTWEVTRVERRSVSRHLFDLAAYKEFEGEDD